MHRERSPHGRKGRKGSLRVRLFPRAALRRRRGTDQRRPLALQPRARHLSERGRILAPRRGAFRPGAVLHQEGVPSLSPRRRKASSPAPMPLPEPASGTCWIETDSYDRARFSELVRDSGSLRALLEQGGVLLPQFGSLAQDVFAALFKYNVVRADEKQ